MSTQRWVLSDGISTWTMPINPDSMTKVPLVQRSVRLGQGNVRDPRVHVFVGPPAPKTLEWAGVIRSKSHYDMLEVWAKKDTPVTLVDHLSRTFQVVIRSFKPVDRSPRPGVPWRMRYTMQCTLLAGPS